MIEKKALFITLDFHTRHDSRLFHLQAFICRNEEWVPIFKLTLPYFLLYKWTGMLFFCLLLPIYHFYYFHWARMLWGSQKQRPLLFCAAHSSPAFIPRRVLDDCRFCAHNTEGVWNDGKEREGDFKKSVSPRLWNEELYRGMLNGLKLKWQPFSRWSGAGSKAWTWFLEQHPPGSGFVCGSGGENKELDCLRPKRRRRRGGRESVSLRAWGRGCLFTPAAVHLL